MATALRIWYVERRVPEYDKQLTSSATYTSNGAFVDTVTDQRGTVTKYDYNQNKELLKSVATNYGAADARTVNYTYNANNDLLTKVYPRERWPTNTCTTA